MRFSLSSVFVHLSVLAATASTAFGSALYYDRNEIVERADQKYVFAHFIVGIVASYQQSDWENDIKLAQAIGIDGFALNIGKDDYNDQQLGFAYAAAQAVGNFNMFISFDFSYWTNGDIDMMSQYMQKWGNMPAQLKIGDAAFVSSFVGDGFPYRDLENQSNVKLFACPNWQPGSLSGNDNADCGFSWLAWPSQNNQPINANLTTDGDNSYTSALAGRPYMMPVSPWFNTHYGTDTYNKNWIFLSDTLWGTRWDQVLQINPQFLEIVTWNDFGESHYIGPLHDDNTSVYAGGDTGAVKWVKGMAHDAWRDVAAAYISAFKSGSSTPNVQTEELVYYYRPNPKDAACSDPVPKPTGSDFDQDSVFVIAMVQQDATVVITSGSNAPVSIDVKAGISTVSAPMGTGTQTFALQRSGNNVFSGNGGLGISNDCTVNNFNAFVGSVHA